MLASTLISTLLGASVALGSPLAKRVFDGTPTVTQILQYALTLEHLEATYYAGALAKFDEAAFLAARLPVWARGRFEQIGEHEKTHVSFLTTALGADAVAACNYSL